MDAIALAVGEASIRDEDYFQQTCRKVSTTRDRSAEALRTLGFTVLPSLTNFLFVTHPNKESAGYLRRPARKGVSLSAISSCRALIITCVSPSAQMSRWIS